jgi:hypothetical protein
MVYMLPTLKTIFKAGEGFWVYEIRGVVALSYTDDQSRALRFETKDATHWEPILRGMAKCKIERIDLPQDSGISVTHL